MRQGDYPTGTTQAMHDAAFDYPPGVSERAVDERADELAREDFDNLSEQAVDWIGHAMTDAPDYVLDVVREAVRWMANPAGSLYSRGGLDDAVSDLRARYVDAYADTFRQQAIAEIADYNEG